MDLQEEAVEAIETGKPEIDPATLSEDQQIALHLMEEVCANSGQEMRPVVRSVSGAYLYIDLVGPEVRMTWGRLGQSLDSLQFLCNLIVSRRVRSDVRIMLDAAEYRERRTTLLIQRATDVANEVKARNEEAEMEPLPAHERRIVHTALANDPDIQTYSEGDEPARRVVIAPRA